jgi:hypothetical protein
MTKGNRYRIDAAGNAADGFTGRLEYYDNNVAWVLCGDLLYKVPVDSLRDRNVPQDETLDVIRHGEHVRMLHTELDEVVV